MWNTHCSQALHITILAPQLTASHPTNWTVISREPQDASSGFEAASYTNGTEIVISFAGTYSDDVTGDIAADIGLATGYGSDQLQNA